MAPVGRCVSDFNVISEPCNRIRPLLSRARAACPSAPKYFRLAQRLGWIDARCATQRNLSVSNSAGSIKVPRIVLRGTI